MATINVNGGSIQAAINNANTGDTVLVAAGTYKERITISKKITVKTTANAKIQSAGWIVNITGAGATLDGFKIERPSWSSGRDDLVTIRGSGVTIKNCEVYIANVTNLAAAKAAWGKEKAAGIIFKANNGLVQDCEVWGANFGISCSDNSGKNSVIRNCNLHHCVQSCIKINHSSKQVRGLLIEGCNINNSYGEDGIQFMQVQGDQNAKCTAYDGIPNRGTIVRNCVFIGNGENDIDFKGAYEIVVEGCIFTRCFGKNNGFIENGGGVSGTIGKGRNSRCESIILRNNICYNGANGFRMPGQNCAYYNNTIINANYGRSGTGIVQDASGSCSGMNADNGGMVNNLLANNKGGQADWERNNGDVDYNLYCTQAGTFKWNGATRDWNGWRNSLSSNGVRGADANGKHYTNWSSINLINCPAFPDNINPSTYNFLPQVGSPAYQAGGHLTKLKQNANGTTIIVNDSKWFCDGFGITNGDTIVIVDSNGSDTRVIRSINGNNITLNQSVNRQAGARVFWMTSAPNIGVIDVDAADPGPVEYIQAGFSTSATTVTVGGTVNFTNTSSSTGAINSYVWKEDGVQFSTAQNPSRQFNTQGSYVITLTVTGEVGTDTASRTITVTTDPSPPPEPSGSITAQYTMSAWQVEAGTTVYFYDASVSDNPITSYSWTIDGVEFATTADTQYTFNDVGTGQYTIVLTVTSVDGSSTRTKFVQVSPATNPDFTIADFTGTPLQIEEGQSVTFLNNSSTSGAFSSYSWKANGVEFSTAANPTYVFNQSGIYDITLDVISTVGSDSITKSAYIEVLVPADPGGGENSLTNGDFASGDYTGWTTYSAGSANFSVVSNAATINVTDTGGNTQLYQSGIQIVKGEEYTFEADLSCDSGTMEVIMRVMQHKSPYTNLILQTINVTATPTTFSFSNTAEWNHSNMRVTFIIRDTGVLNVDNVSFGRPSQPTEPDPPDPPPGTGGDVGRIIAVDLNTSTGNQSISMGDATFTPNTCVAFIVPAYTGSNPVDGEAMSIGFGTYFASTAVNHSIGWSSQHNVATTAVARRMDNGSLGRIPTYGDRTTDQVDISLVSMATNNITINVDTAPASAFRLILWCFAADEAEINAVQPSTSVDGSVTVSNTMSAAPTMGFCATAAANTSTYPSSSDNDAEVLLGFAGNGSGQHSIYRKIGHNQATGSVESYVKSGRFAVYGNDTANAELSFTSSGADLITKTTNGSWNPTFPVLLMRFADVAAKVVMDTPAGTTGTKTHTIGQLSQFLGAIVTTMQSEGTYYTDYNAGGLSVGGWDSSNEKSVAVATEDGADPTNNQSSFDSSNAINLYAGNGVPAVVGNVTGNNGTNLDINYSAVSPIQMIFFSLQGETSGSSLDEYEAYQQFGFRYLGRI